MNETTPTYEIGDTVTYRLFSGALRTGRVIMRHDDIKNGRPGFDMVDAAGDHYWGYDGQITLVAPYGTTTTTEVN